MIISQNCGTPSSTVNVSHRQRTPMIESTLIESNSGYPLVAHPRQQHRRSRSLTEIWLEHRPQGTISTGFHQEILFFYFDCTLFFLQETILQPKFTKKVSTKKVPAKEEIVRTTKYVLTHQNLDEQGEIVTDFVKVK